VSKRLLVIEAHSDDSVIGAYGMIRRLQSRGYSAHFVVVAAGDVDFLHCGRVQADWRKNEYAAYVGRIGGVWEDSEFPLDCESRLDCVGKAQLVSLIERVILRVRPDTIICQAPSFHQDHTAVYEATMAAIRPTQPHCPEEVLLMENPTYVHSLGPGTDFRPTTYCPLGEVELEEKIRCFAECFPSQIREQGNCLSPEGIRAWARYRGLECRAEYAEAFMTHMRRV